MQRFKDKNIMVTGAASGIGNAIAVRIAQEGGNLALLDMNLDKLKKAADELKQYGTKIVFEKCDVSDFDGAGNAINKTVNELGGLHALSNNAGILYAYATHEMTLSQWNQILNTNLTGTFIICRHALPHLLKNEHSFIVNNCSNAVDKPSFWIAAYVASKGGIRAFTRALANEYGVEGLHANCVLPGMIQTELAINFKIPASANPKLTGLFPPMDAIKLSDPKYVASVVAMLLSEDARHINGSEITIDGGAMY